MIRSQTYSENQYLVSHLVDQDGVRLDAFLKDKYRKRSREQVKRVIDQGSVAILRNQGPHLTLGRLKPSLQLLAGDEVQVVSERKPEPEVSFNYSVLFEDETLLIIDKPANLPVHPAGRYFFNTLLIHLRTHGHTGVLREGTEYFLVHRIDKETSGVLALTKDRAACTALAQQFRERSTQKRYLAIVHGTPAPEFNVDLGIKRSTTSAIELKMAIASESEGGQTAFTGFKRLQTFTRDGRDFSVVECLPKTGRQHQIRLHLEASGHPIVGDKLYGMPESEALRFFERRHLSPEAQAKLLLPRHALHAEQLQFEHPVTGASLVFQSPLPEDLRRFLESS